MYKGKAIKDFEQAPDFKILGGPYTIDDETFMATVLRDEFTDEDGIYKVVADFMENRVLCFENDKLKAVWACYDLRHISVNGKRGMVKSMGHETIEEYWFDNGEFSRDYTR